MGGDSGSTPLKHDRKINTAVSIFARMGISEEAVVLAVIFDADGTLCDVGHRLHFLASDPKDWQSFHDGIANDTPIEPVTWIAKLINDSKNRVDGVGQRHAVLIVTARHETYRAMTEKWFADHGVTYDRLYMRADNDRRPDHDVKADILQQIVADGYDPFLVFDDRPEVVAMWRDWGIVCLQCAPDEPKSKLEGQHLLTLLVGPAGSGKSTHAAKNYRESEIISTDRIRAQEGYGHSPEDLNATFRLARSMARARVENGLHTVIDATNLKRKDRLAFIKAVPKGIVVHYVLFDRDYDEKIKHVTEHRPAHVIDRHHKTFRDTTLKEVKDADGLGNVIVIDKREKR